MTNAADGDEGAEVLQVARRDDGEGDARSLLGFLLEGLQSADDEVGGRRARDLVEDAEVDRRKILALG